MLGESKHDLFGHHPLGLLVRAIYLGHQGREDRRAGRHLHDLGSRPGSRGGHHRVHDRPDGLGDIVALRASLRLINQVYLNIRNVISTAQIVVSNHAVEIEGRCHSGVYLHVRDLRHRSQSAGHIEGEGGAGLQGRAFGQVQDHLHLVLVVERKHLHHDRAGEEQAGRPEEKHYDHGERGDQPGGLLEERLHEPLVGPVDLRLFQDVAGLVTLSVVCLAEQPEGQPRGPDQGHEQREHHREARPNRHRTHVRTHQS